MRVRTARTGAARAELLRAASIFVPAADGLARLVAEAQTAGAAIAAPPGRAEQPELAAAETARMIEDEAFRARRAAESLAAAQSQTTEALADRVEEVYERLASRRRAPARRGHRSRSATGSSPTSTCTRAGRTTARSTSTSSSTTPRRKGSARSRSPTTTSSAARSRPSSARAAGSSIVIPGEEVKTADQGEVIGLFLREEIPRGMSFGETIAAIRAQGGLVYVPHPFDRMHAIPEPATLHRHLAEIDVLEVYNARLLFEAYNEEALRFARKYNLTPGAGSDAHVLAGVGTGVVRMRRFSGPEEFLVSLHDAEVLRRPKSLVYLQGLKWVAQAKERVR